ncbi:MAG: hypothetical protein Kow0042_26950 [Calditrichia bacterium]
MELIPGEKSVTLKWQVENLKDFTGFNLYRSVDTDDSFSLYKTFSADEREYIDTDVEQSRWYFYRMTLLGQSLESMPSNITKVLLGPGTIWLLSRYGYSIQQYAYDLIYLKNLFNTTYPPTTWAMNPSEGEIWLVYPPYRAVSRFDLNLGYENIFITDSLRYPIDAVLGFNNERLLVLDQTMSRIYVYWENLFLGKINLPGDGYFRLLFIPNQTIAAMSNYDIRLYNSDGDSLNHIRFAEDGQGKDMIFTRGMIYILIANDTQKSSQIITYNVTQHTIERITLDGIFNLVRKEPDSSYFWVTEVLNENNHRLVKLSIDGNRLLELSMVNQIYDFDINPIDHSLVTIEKYGNELYSRKVALYDKEGNLLSSTTNVWDAIKVAIQ